MLSNQFLFKWAKDNRKRLCKEFFWSRNVPSGQKVALFMAWSPGAGKTEFIKRLLSDNQESWYYVLDLDEIRWWMPGYNGRNAEKYTKWAIKILEMLFDECVHYEYPFILDGTFTSTGTIDRNIERLIRKNYEVDVFYIHLLPELAWLYTLCRWKEEWRLIPVNRFIHDYYVAPENVCLFAEKYPEKMKIFIVNRTYKNWESPYEIFAFENHMSIHNFLDKHAIINYTVWNRLSKCKYQCYKFISFIPYLWKKILLQILAKKEQWLSKKS